MVGSSTPASHRSAVDSTGRAIPMSEPEVRARAAAIARGLAALDEMGDEDEQRATLEFLVTAIDEDRLSNRQRFR
jgi:hypothetical protein